MENYLKDFEKFMIGTRNLKASSVRMYVNKLRLLERHFKKPLPEISTLEFQTYFIKLKETHRINTQRLRQSSVKVFFDWFCAEYDYPNPVALLQVINKEYVSPDIINPNEVLLMIDACGLRKPASFVRDLRNAAIICLLADTGIRVSELANLNVNSISREGNRFTVKIVGTGTDSTKSYRQRQIPFCELNEGDAVSEHWAAYWMYLLTQEKRLPTQPLFMRGNRGDAGPGRLGVCSIQQMIRSRAKKAGLTKNVTPHSFRHFYATYFIANDGRLDILKTRLGHATLASTERYLHTADLVKTDSLGKNPMTGQAPLNRQMKQFVKILKADKKG